MRPEPRPKSERAAAAARLAAITLLAVAASIFGKGVAADSVDDAGFGWREALVARIDNVDLLDADDSELVGFIRSIRRDRDMRPPIRELLGPFLKNPTFSGIAYDAWLELALLAPVKPGPLAVVWVFPVENRDEYRNHLIRQGLIDYEALDDTVILGENGPNGQIVRWYIEWLPGNVALFGDNVDAVRAARGIYAAAAARNGLLGAKSRQTLSPDIRVQFHPARFAAWQDRDTGVYWWRSRVTRLSADVASLWPPASSTKTKTLASLAESLAESLAAWPRSGDLVNVNLWFDTDGVEWNSESTVLDDTPFPSSNLEAARRIPGNFAYMYAVTLDQGRVSGMISRLGEFFLQTAGGVVPPGARKSAEDFSRALLSAAPRQIAIALLPPPADSPRFGATRMVVLECDRPERLDAAWEIAKSNITLPGMIRDVFLQIGWDVGLTPAEGIAGGWIGEITPIAATAGEASAPFFNVGYVARRSGRWLVLAGGRIPEDSTFSGEVFRLWSEAAETALAQESPPGPGEIRETFTRVEASGAAFLAVVNPVRLFQLSLDEVADWRPTAPDEPTPASVALAEEMAEYGAKGGALGLTGSKQERTWTISGSIPWGCLRDTALSLGIADKDGM